MPAGGVWCLSVAGPTVAQLEIILALTICESLLCVHSVFASVLMGTRELVALLSLSFWCIVIVVWLFLAMPRVCLLFVIVVFPDHTHVLFLRVSCNAFHIVAFSLLL